MSYCRFGPESDVYVYHHVYGALCCCSCSISQSPMFFYRVSWQMNIPREQKLNELLRRKNKEIKVINKPDKKTTINTKPINKKSKPRNSSVSIRRKRVPIRRKLIAVNYLKPIEKIIYIFYNRDFLTHSRGEMILHLNEHKERGHLIPSEPIKKLSREIIEEGDHIKNDEDIDLESYHGDKG